MRSGGTTYLIITWPVRILARLRKSLELAIIRAHNWMRPNASPFHAYGKVYIVVGNMVWDVSEVFRSFVRLKACPASFQLINLQDKCDF
jgi:hypothetical protein